MKCALDQNSKHHNLLFVVRAEGKIILNDINLGTQSGHEGDALTSLHSLQRNKKTLDTSIFLTVITL